MYWEKKLYIFTIAFVVGILLTFGIYPILPVSTLFFILISILVVGLFFCLYSYKKWGYIKRLPVLIIFYLLPLIFGVFLAHNSFDTNKEGNLLKITAGKNSVNATVRAYIYREPDFFENKVRVYLKPLKISINGKKSKEVKSGKILMTYSWKKGRYPKFLNYGHFITFTGTLKRPQGPTNPGGFDYRKFLGSNHIYYTAYFKNTNDITADEIVKKNSFIGFSLNINRKFLKTIRRTVPFPESAFLGGITLGLRYGLDGIFLPNATYQIKDDFKRAGVNHVLAVSGLHVSILTLFFMGIFSFIGVPKKIYAPITIILLLIFATITGGRPSTLRAVIMHSIFLITWGFSKKGFRASVEVAITLAALLILLFNPLLLREASFTLSFGAVLALVLITPFLDGLFKKYLIGYTFWTVLALFLGFTAMLIFFKYQFFNSPFLWLYFIASAVIIYISVKLEEKTELPYPSYRKFNNTLISFISSQFAIQFGMMIPLSAYYFGRYPIAGMYANFIAIPLIGLNVQLGMFASILSFIPFVGIHFALFINAANYMLLKAFIYCAHFFSTIFPYPYVHKNSFGGLLFYFIVLIMIISISWIKGKYIDYKYYITIYKQKKDKRYKSLKILPYIIIVIFVVISLVLLHPQKRDNDLDITVFSLSTGNVGFIKTLNGENILINSGKHSLYKRREWDEADRVIMGVLMHYGINHLDRVIMTDNSVDNSSAFPTILREYPVKHFYSPTNTKNIVEMDYEAFLTTTNDSYLLDHSEAYWVKGRYKAEKRINAVLKNVNIRQKVVKAGDYILKEKKKVGNIEKTLEIYLLGPETKKDEDYFQDNMVIKIDYMERDLNSNLVICNKQFVFTGDLGKDATAHLEKYKKYLDKVDVFVAPTRFVYNYKLKDILQTTLPADFLFHINYFKYDKEMTAFTENFGFLKEKAGTNFFDLSKGYVRYKIKNGKLRRDASKNATVSPEISDMNYEF
jgi:ComEC/Rec2-related protein